MKMLERVDQQLNKYKSEHNGQAPLYIQVSSFESERIWEEVRSREGLPNNEAITTYKGSKIVENAALKKGDVILSDELPESGS